ncbi:MAG: hypothetical protein IBX57_11660 [Gammaproteobacteria bacterium]|nr:hypothetical protein [Gammaproteobacteria bacterium]
MNVDKAMKYPWAQELEKTVVNSLATSFGLDFLLFQDKLGGDVDTIHNARQGVYANDNEKQRYESRGEYDKKKSEEYHKEKNYIDRGKSDKQSHKDGVLHDTYRNKNMSADEKGKRDLDHVQSAKEIHDDPGRVLAEIDGAKIANRDTNLQSTHSSVNRSKGKKPIEEFLAELPKKIEQQEDSIRKKKDRLKCMPCETPEQQHKARELEDEIRKTEEKVAALKSIDPDAMRKKDEEARNKYNQEVNLTYYTSSKFIKNTAIASGTAGFKMGARQMLGLILAEFWFELREQVPSIFNKLREDFNLEKFIGHVVKIMKGVWKRIKLRFNEFLVAFKDGFFAGVLASATTTMFNIFATTQKMTIKIIREVWGQLVKAIKLVVFNPEKLSFVDLCKAVTAVLSVGVATVLGTMVYSQLLPLCNFPFGGELAAFASAFVTGVITLGLNYLLLYSGLAKKMWEVVGSIMPNAGVVKSFQAVNAELDRYLIELYRVEFNLDADELEEFSQQLVECNSEMQRSILLHEEVARRNIELPYEMGCSASTRKWLASLAK